MTKITIRKAGGTWVVRAAGAVIAESKAALELSEPGCDDVIYFPREDVAMAFLDDSPHSTHCPHKGDASYFSIASKNRTLENSAWSYEAPKDEVARIKDHIAFVQGDYLTVERL